MKNLKKDFEKFYLSNVDKVYRFVFFRCQDKELAEDLVSEIFMKALGSFEKYDSEISKTAWLMTIAKNHLANHWRDRKPAVSLEKIMEEESGDAAWLRQGLIAAESKGKKEAVYEILAKLKAEEAEIVTLHYIVGYSYSEIAEIIGSSEGAVKVAAHRILKKMRGLI